MQLLERLANALSKKRCTTSRSSYAVIDSTLGDVTWGRFTISTNQVRGRGPAYHHRIGAVSPGSLEQNRTLSLQSYLSLSLSALCRPVERCRHQ
jgi:hypothetical protein